MSKIIRSQFIEQFRVKDFQKKTIMKKEKFEVILLGTGTPIPSKIRACASTLVLISDKAFLVDTGRGFLNNFVKTGLMNVNAVLFTHFHSDHFAEFGEFMVTRMVWGIKEPMMVIGPSGAEKTIGTLMKAYELDNFYRKQHHKENWNEQGMLLNIKEYESGIIYDQDGIKITMFMVDHDPVKPAVGYRFEYNNQILVISGDTKSIPIMEEMAKNADILIHEALNRQLLIRFQHYMNKRMQQILADILDYHASTLEVAKIAQNANVKTLVLTHLIPGLPPLAILNRLFKKGMKKIYKGRIIVGKDGMKIKL